MDAVDDPKDLALTEALLVRLLRLRAGKSQRELAEGSGLSPRTPARLEKGEARPRRKTLHRLAQATGTPPLAVDRFLTLLGTWRTVESGDLPARPSVRSGSFPAEIAAVITETLELAGGLLTITPAPACWEPAERPRPEDRHRADQLWERFRRRDRAQQSRLVRESSAFHLWSFSERLGQESRKALPHSPEEALELARLALEVARQVRGTVSWRARVEAHALLHLGQAHQACHQPEEARAALARVRRLREAFSPDDPEPFSGSHTREL